MLHRSGVSQAQFKGSTIPVGDSARHVREDLRRRGYLQHPHVEVDYTTGAAGDYIHPDFVNFDMLARQINLAYKARMLGEDLSTQRLCVEPSDDFLE